ncbi:CBN-GES-1 protein [Aphelenchoides avenae]|nr:CBN-GES-1 protein [Aphelenchus avenae]
MSEDCLYMNIIAPHNKTGKYPVLFIVHGSGFTMGSAHMYRDYSDIASSFVSRGIVVVIIQYRLAVYGFAALGSEELQGNLGLWDQIAALQFVKANIAAFGGLPEQITVFGASAGSSSVSALSVSPHSRDLFSQAIQLAGSSLSEWSMSDYTLTATQKLLKSLRCASDSPASAKQCLKEATAVEMAAAAGKTLPEIVRLHTNFVTFGPRIDGDLFPKPINELLKEAPVKATYVGMSEEEVLCTKAFLTISAIMAPPFAPAFFQLYVPPAKQASFSYDDFVSFVRSVVATKEAFGDKVDDVAEKIIAFYLRRNASEVANNVFHLTRYTQLCSDIQFNIPILREAILKTELGWPIQPQPIVDDELFGDRLKFWNDLTNEYGFDIVEGIAVRRSQVSDEL